MVVLGVAGEHGVADPAERVSLLARVLLDRDLPAGSVEPMLVQAKGTYREDAFGARAERGVRCARLAASRLLGRIDDALDARPKGKLRHRALSNLPVVGVFGGYAAEREGAAPGGRARAASRASAGAVRTSSSAGSLAQVGVDLPRRRRPVQGDEVDAGHALGQQRAAQLGGDLDAERAHGALSSGRSPSTRGEPLGEVGRERLRRTAAAKRVDLPTLVTGMIPGDDRHVAAGRPRRGRAAAGSPRRRKNIWVIAKSAPARHLRDEDRRRRCRSPASAGASPGRPRRRRRSRPIG